MAGAVSSTTEASAFSPSGGLPRLSAGAGLAQGRYELVLSVAGEPVVRHAERGDHAALSTSFETSTTTNSRPLFVTTSPMRGRFRSRTRCRGGSEMRPCLKTRGMGDLNKFPLGILDVGHKKYDMNIRYTVPNRIDPGTSSRAIRQVPFRLQQNPSMSACATWLRLSASSSGRRSAS